jgi:hypothetical protein
MLVCFVFWSRYNFIRACTVKNASFSTKFFTVAFLIRFFAGNHLHEGPKISSTFGLHVGSCAGYSKTVAGPGVLFKWRFIEVCKSE